MGTDPSRSDCDSGCTVHCRRPDPPLTPYNDYISKRHNPMTDTQLQDLRFDYSQYLLEWIDNGGEPMTFEEFVAECAA
jgi:hypothetical protein